MNYRSHKDNTGIIIYAFHATNPGSIPASHVSLDTINDNPGRPKGLMGLPWLGHWH